MDGIIGYKALDKNFCFGGIAYEVGKTLTISEKTDCKIKDDTNLWDSGFVFCQYPCHALVSGISNKVRYAKVSGKGPVAISGSHCCTTTLEVLAEVDEADLRAAMPNNVVLPDGTQEWWNCGERHRDCDEPALIYRDGSRSWYRHGKLHRDGDKPAYIDTLGTMIWYRNGRIHRGNGRPAIVSASGSAKWFVNGVLHRERRPAVEEFDGTMKWYCRGELHRDNGLPAIEIPDGGIMRWYIHGRLHRSGGEPAIVKADGSKHWYVDGWRCRETPDGKVSNLPTDEYPNGVKEWWSKDGRTLLYKIHGEADNVAEYKS